MELFLNRLRPAGDGDDAGAADFDQPAFAHQRDEAVDLVAVPGDFEDEAGQRRVDHLGAEDVREAQRQHLRPAGLARLPLSAAKLEAMHNSLEPVVRAPDPIGRVVSTKEISPGLVLQKETAPLGVLLAIFEVRSDTFALFPVVSGADFSEMWCVC